MRSQRHGISTVEYLIVLGGIVVALIVALPYLSEGQTDVFRLVHSGLESEAGDRVARSSTGSSSNSPSPARDVGSIGQRAMFTAVVFLVGSSMSLLLYFRQRAREKKERQQAARREQRRRPKDRELVRRRMEEKRNNLNRILQHQWSSVVRAEIRVGDLMTTQLITVDGATPVEKIEMMLLKEQFHHVLVTDAAGKFLGIISDRDVQRRPGNVAADIMTREPLTVRPDTDIKQAITVILMHGFSALPVVDEGRLVGIVTTNDMVATLHCTLVQLMEFSRLLTSEEGRQILAKNL